MERIKFIADHFGHETQRKKAHEEFIEAAESNARWGVVQTFCNDPAYTEQVRKEYVGELADALIMIKQQVYQISDPDEFKAVVDAKIERTLNRIETGYYE